MATQGKIKFGLGFEVDRSGLNELKQQLQSLQQLKTDDLVKIGSKDAVKDLASITKAASAVEEALEKSFNPKLNTTDLTKFREALSQSGYNIKTLQNELNKAGATGQSTFRNITTELLTTNRNLKETNKWLDKMGETLTNTIRWSIASTALNSFTEQIQKAWSFTKQLDASLNDIQIVTQMSAEEMDKFAVKATKAAQALGATTTNYSNAALIYYQQGLDEQEVQARAATTVKVANVTGQSANTVSEQLTAVWNGYKVNAEEAELYVDKLSAVARTTAADLEELSVGMSRVASAANIMGVDVDQLNAQLATIVSVTREAPETIGTALKTVYARMSDIETGLDTETTLGEYTQQMQALGINVLDAAGNLRDMGAVVEEIGSKWDSLNRNQQTSLAQAIAGTRQYSRMMALFDNWDMYQSSKNVSQNSIGELQKQQEIYMNSMEAHLNQLTAESQELYQTLMDPEGLNPLIDGLTSIVGLLENIIQGLGGGAGALATFGAIGLNVFGDQITKGITRTIRNITGFKDNLRQANAELAITQELGLSNNLSENTRQQNELIKAYKARADIMSKLSEEERKETDELFKQVNAVFQKKDGLEEEKRILEEIVQRHTGVSTNIHTDAQTPQTDLENSSAQLRGYQIENIEHKAFATAYTTVETQAVSALRRDRHAEAAEQAQTYEARLEQETRWWEQAARNQEATQKLVEVNEEYSASFKSIRDSIEKAVEGEDKKLIFDKGSEQQKERLINILNKLNAAIDENGNIITENKHDIKAAEEAAVEFNRILEEMAQEADKAAKRIPTLNKELSQTEDEAAQAEAALNKLKKNFELTKVTGEIVDLAGGIANMASAAQNFINLGSIWQNEDLSVGEKLLQTISNLAFMVPMVIKGFTDARKSLSSLLGSAASALEYLNIKQAKTTAETTANTVAEVANAGAKLLTAKASDVKEHQLDEESAALRENTGENIINAGSETLDAKEKFKNLKDLVEQVKIWGQNHLGLLKWIGAAAAAVAIVAAGTAITVSAITAAEEKEKKALEEANKQAQGLQLHLNEIQAETQNLDAALQNLTSATDTLEGLTEGTIEWRKALNDVNTQVLELLKEYPELMSYIRTDANGVMSIEQEGLNKIQEKQLSALQTAQAGALAADMEAQEAKIALLRNQSAEKITRTENQELNAGLNVGVLGAAGAAVGAVAGPLGMIIGAAIGTVTAAVASGIKYAIDEAREDGVEAQLQSDNMRQIVKAYQTSGEVIFDSANTLAKALNKDVSALTDMELALLEDKEPTLELVDALAQHQATLQANLIQMGAGLVGEDASIGEQYQAGRIYDQYYGEIVDNLGGLTTELAKEALAAKGIDMLSEEDISKK